jgi:ankyrin repeat protein
VKLLIAKGAEVQPADVKLEATAHVAASAAGDPDVLQALIEAGVDVARKVEPMNEFSSTPIFTAVQNDNFDAVRILVQHGATIDERDGQGMTPLIWAALAHRTRMVKALLALGADASLKDKYDFTALMHTNDFDFADARTAELLNPVQTAKAR